MIIMMNAEFYAMSFSLSDLNNRSIRGFFHILQNLSLRKYFQKTKIVNWFSS